MSDLRTIERESIRAFVQSAADDGYLDGRVLDYGCGKQPYRDIVEAADGEYVGFDREFFPGNVSAEDIGSLDKESPEEGTGFNAILCTQVVQYIPMAEFPAGEFLSFLKWLIVDHGYLVMTYPTNWPEVEPEDLHRFTKAGMERLLTEAGFEIVRHEQRGRHIFFAVPGGHYLNHGRGEIALGYGVIARA